jgi:hypothetical protein
VVTEERLDACRSRLEHVAEHGLGEQADALEFVHRSLVAELDDLLDEARRDPRDARRDPPR